MARALRLLRPLLPLLPRLLRPSPPRQPQLPVRRHPRQLKPPHLLLQCKARLPLPLLRRALPALNAFTPLRWSVASPKNTASIFLRLKVPGRAVASPSRTLKQPSRKMQAQPVAHRRPRSLLPRHPPPRVPRHRRPLQPRLPRPALQQLTAPNIFRRCSSAFLANAFTSAITKCNRSASCARKSPSTWSPPSTFRRTFTQSTKSI